LNWSFYTKYGTQGYATSPNQRLLVRLLFVSDATTPSGPWPPHSRGL